MINLVLITSIIYTPNTPLSYISNRSIYTPDERFEQTKNTIATLREKIPNLKIILVECSNLTEEQNNFFISNTDYFLNLIDDEDKKNKIYSISKALGEGTMTITAIEYIKNNNIIFDNFFKITGRYWLSEHFNYNNFDNNDIIIHRIHGDINNIATSLYKLHSSNLVDFYEFLVGNIDKMYQCIGYEVLFALFINLYKQNNVIHFDKTGVNGYISVSGDLIDN